MRCQPRSRSDEATPKEEVAKKTKIADSNEGGCEAERLGNTRDASAWGVARVEQAIGAHAYSLSAVCFTAASQHLHSWVGELLNQAPKVILEITIVPGTPIQGPPPVPFAPLQGK
ncbi:hypothetical protein NDU88_002463 [Pleurodeles waltl]|uniref:Uncharacterized protein n=1 Tax=Pleurodeles waltl TaxID=8319 RepID=A0AAV7NFI5_PLEWA|nr:hypothetical protein NDU88_002463 [Pleurodeles waltl]